MSLISSDDARPDGPTLVLCYDVVENRRRRALYRGLHAFLLPVQKSVFEGRLVSTRREALRRLVGKTIDRDTDTVRIYTLCRACQRGGELIGTAWAVPTEPEDVVL